ncbi:Hsc70-interacting protein [Habropoda laboriosa]|uniref:Hsc70-interacting protein n=1 Tax=Habropoda laboriosa TaxID=597456 RepID=A0A0L7R5W7_9HYME|nr:Hsc70-interacting protein [Habropoda laboriosa]
MSVPLEPQHIEVLKTFVDLCIKTPAILHQPEFSFVKEFIEHFGGNIPKAKIDESPSKEPKDANVPKESKPEPKPIPKEEPKEEAKAEPEPEAGAESEESDLELDMTGVIEPDTDAPQKMGNLTLQPTEEEIAESQAKRSEAVSAFAEKDYEKAIELYTEAIVLNPQAALLYAKRGQIYLILNKPNACIRDCDRALELNPDSAAAHKFRGRAYHLLGKFEEAVTDLRLACKFDFDEQADEWLREVTPNARKIEEHNRKKERKIQEQLEKERQEMAKIAQEAAKAYRENTRTSQTDASGNVPGLSKFVNDPGVAEVFKDPELVEVLNEITENPENLLKYQSNPKVMSCIEKLLKIFLKTGGVPYASTTPEAKPEDVGLD